MWSNFGKSVELERVLYVPVQHGHPSFYSNNVFYEAVDVLRFSGSGIVPSEGGEGGVCVEGIGDILKLAKCNNVSACSRKFLWSIKCLTQASLLQKTLGRKWTSGRGKKE